MTKKQFIDITLWAAFAFTMMGLIGNWTQSLTAHTPKHTSSLKQYVQPCTPQICVKR